MEDASNGGPIRDLKAFQRDGEARRGRGSMALIGLLILIAAGFGWFFSGYKNQRKAIFDKAKIFEVIVDGAAVSQNNRPDILDSVVQVPAGASIRVECETTRLRDEVRFEAKVGEALLPGDLCDFQVAAPAVPGQRVAVSLAMLSREDGKVQHQVEFTVASAPALDWFRITHLLVPGEDKSVSEEGLYVTHRADVFGKFVRLQVPPEGLVLEVGFVVGRANDPEGFVMAVDELAAAKGEVRPITAKLERYRNFGPNGGGFWFRSPSPVAFGKEADGNLVFQVVAVVGTRADLEGLAHKAWAVEAPGKPLKPRGIGLADARASAWSGAISDDLRVIRVAAGQTAPRPVKWRTEPKAEKAPAEAPSGAQRTGSGG